MNANHSLQTQHTSHSNCRFFLGCCGDMGIGIQSEAGGEVTEDARYGFDVHTILQGYGGEGVPLRYNYDKPEKPRIPRVFGCQVRFFILFQPEKSSREVIIS